MAHDYPQIRWVGHTLPKSGNLWICNFCEFCVLSNLIWTLFCFFLSLTTTQTLWRFSKSLQEKWNDWKRSKFLYQVPFWLLDWQPTTQYSTQRIQPQFRSYIQNLHDRWPENDATCCNIPSRWIEANCEPQSSFPLLPEVPLRDGEKAGCPEG